MEGRRWNARERAAAPTALAAADLCEAFLATVERLGDASRSAPGERVDHLGRVPQLVDSSRSGSRSSASARATRSR